MSDPARQSVELLDFPGLFANQDPRDIPAGGATVQNNLCSFVKGEAQVRLGYKILLFEVTMSSHLTTRGDLWGFSTTDERIPVGTDGYVLTADSTASVGVSWQAPAGSDPKTAVYPSFTVSGISDEFAGTSLAVAWVAVNSGSHLPTVTVQNNVLSLLHPGSDAGVEMHAWVQGQTLATGDYIETCFRFAGNNQNYNACGLVVSDGVTYGAGKQIVFYFSFAENKWWVYKVTNFNTFGASQAGFLGNYSAGGGDTFLRLKYMGSLGWLAYISPDGVSWAAIAGTMTIGSSVDPGTAGTNVGIWVTTNTGTNQCVFSFRYFKKGP